jgi:hypothetical protein
VRPFKFTVLAGTGASVEQHPAIRRPSVPSNRRRAKQTELCGSFIPRLNICSTHLATVGDHDIMRLTVTAAKMWNS